MTEGSGARAASDLPVKMLVGAVLAGVAVASLVFGGLAFWIFISIFGVLMMAEWADLAGVERRHKQIALFAASVPLAILSPLAAGPGFFALGLIAGAAFFVVIVTRSGQLALGVPYVALPIAALLFIRAWPDGAMLAFWTLAIVWATDIGGYFVGKAFGGPRLMPSVSPNKTWSGLFGGMAAAALTGLGFALWGGLAIELALLSPLLAAVAQGGDLFESALKRRAGVKDSGSLLPGHGGILDRVDGIVPVAPMVAALLVATAAA